MTDPENGAAEAAPADDLRSTLTAALAESEQQRADDAASAEKPKPAAEKPAAEAASGEPDKGAEPAKGAAAEPDKPEPKKAEAEEKPAAEGAADKKPADDKAAKAEADKKARAELTGKWSAKDKETFGKLTPEGQDLFLRRHKEMEGAFTKKTQEIAAFRNEYGPVDEMFTPWRDKMKAAGFTPGSMIKAWANVEQRLMKRDGDSHACVAGIIKSYQLDLGKIAQALGLKPAQAGEQPRADGSAQPDAPKPNGHAPIPPELEQELTALRRRADERDQRDQAAAQAARTAAEQRVMKEIDDFKSAQDDKGNLLHPHFDEIEDAMNDLAAAAIAARKPVPSLHELYEKAVWANPSTRDAMLAAKEEAREAETKAQQEKAAKDARAKAEAARKAGSSVHGAPGGGQAPGQRRAPERTLREELETAAAQTG